MERKISVMRLGIIVLAALSVIAMDVRFIRQVSGKGIETYRMQTGASEVLEVQSGEFEGGFQAVSPKLTFVGIRCEAGERASGSVSYQIESSGGKPVLFEQAEELSDLWDGEGSCLRLDVSGAEFEMGQQYRVRWKLASDAPLRVLTDGSGIMLAQYYQAEYQGILYVGLLLLHLLLAGGLAAAWKWGLTDRAFLAMSVIVGILAVLLTPPFARDDEFRHFARAYDWSRGGNVGYYDVPGNESVGNVYLSGAGKAQLIQVPKEISELRMVAYDENYHMVSYFAEVNNSLCIPKLISIFSQSEKEGMAEVSEAATAEKGLESYWPQAIMIALGRLLGLRSGFWYYLAGIGQAVASSLLLWVALRLTDGHKNLIWMYGFIPAASLLRGSCNPDGLMMAEILLALAVVLHLRERGMDLLEKKAVGLLALYAALVASVCRMKLPYAVLCLGFLLMLGKKNLAFVNREWVRRHRRRLICGAGASLALAFGYLIGIRKGDLFFETLFRFLPQGHFAYILDHFPTFLRMYLSSGRALLMETFEALRGDSYMPYGVLAGIVLLLSEKKFSVLQKGYQVFLYLCVLGMIVLVGYTLTPPDYGKIWGITYRYMLPALPAFGLALPFGNKRTEHYVNQLYPIAFVPMLFASCLAWMNH